jgi:hypothetical protein
MAELGIDLCEDRFWQQFAERLGDLGLHPRVRLAEVMAARVERATERADRAGISRAGGGILGLEMMLADTAFDGFDGLPALFRLARDVIFSPRRMRDQRRGGKRDRERDEG